MLATLMGILVPLTLGRLGADPAVSSGVFVSTITDMFGFFVFPAYKIVMVYIIFILTLLLKPEGLIKE